ncbi:hypothetical protein NONO_c59830 [Nocardia nova SH22a]|uniref:Uncharacterized protein n=1 Tax=Nocardia nova SH22a TaxID=1415166 RepID=W5TNM3_9NOCA|nr:hypothetical protein [Nocardia nova]AHH20759.1 hypothetical protein NONO_c59830 [Nocardia nova SH22a]
MSGSAYRTPIRPRTEFGAFTDGAAVYAVYPPTPYVTTSSPTALGVTSHVIVSMAARKHETVVYPCTPDGELLSWEPVATVDLCDHGRGLRATGYDMEVVAR